MLVDDVRRLLKRLDTLSNPVIPEDYPEWPRSLVENSAKARIGVINDVRKELYELIKFVIHERLIDKYLKGEFDDRNGSCNASNDDHPRC